MLTPEQHLDNLVRHIDMVRNACLRLGKHLMAEGRLEFGRIVIARGFTHDASKFLGIEWDFLHAGRDVPAPELELAIRQHRLTNAHHPEYWGGFENMPEVSIAEMACDCYARGAEFGTDLRQWIQTVAVPKYNIDVNGQRYRWLVGFVEVLLEDHFRR
jgi:hypothetical protein